MPGVRGALSRASTASSTWPVTVRPKRASHAAGIASVLSIVPVAVPSAISARYGAESLSVMVSAPSSCASSSTRTATVLDLWPGANRSAPEAAA